MTSAFDATAQAAILDALPDPVVIVGPDVTLRWANARAEQTFGWRLDEIRGQSLVPFVHPDDLDTALVSLNSVSSKVVGTLIEIRVKHQDGSFVWIEVRGAPVPEGSEADDRCVALVAREITDRRAWELGAGDSAQLGAILDATPTITLLLDPEGRILGASRALTRQLHRPLDQTLGRRLESLADPADREVIRAAIAACDGGTDAATIEASLLAADGAIVPMSLTFVDLLSDSAVKGIVVAASDISALASARSELHHLANHDDLTGLPNRSSLHRRLAEVLTREPAEPHTLIFGDVDGLKQVNDRYGHHAGDALLAEVAARLRQAVRHGDFVARLSGDEFVVMVSTDAPTVVAEVQDRIRSALEPPARLPDGTLVVTSMSLGAAATEPGISADEVLAVADAAMYVAKRGRAR